MAERRGARLQFGREEHLARGKQIVSEPQRHQARGLLADEAGGLAEG